MTKLPQPRRLLRCDAPSHDDGLVGRDLPIFDDMVTTIDSPPAEDVDVLLIVDALIDELAIALDEPASRRIRVETPRRSVPVAEVA